LNFPGLAAWVRKFLVKRGRSESGALFFSSSPRRHAGPEKISTDTLAGEKIEAKLSQAPANGEPIGGIKVVAQNGWFAARPSGTEVIYKIYTESFKSREYLLQIQQEAREIVSDAFKAAGV
jgi:phosphoglucomutase